MSDSTCYLQIKIDRSRDANKVARIKTGIWEISDTLWLTQTKRGFDTLHLKGEHQGYHWGSSSGVIIDARKLTDRPAIAIQGARSVEISGIQIIGGNDIRPSHPKELQSAYVKDGFSNNRYMPHCGICIDPNEGSNTSKVTLNKVIIRDFVVGIMCSPNNTVQGDSINIDLVEIDGGDIGIAYGQGQARANNITRTNIGFVRTCIDGVTYGKQQGASPKITGGQYGQSFRLFDLHKSFGSTFSVSNLYTEAVRCIGRYGYGPTRSRQPAVFNGVDFNIKCDVYPYYPLSDIFGAWGPVLFNGCWFDFNAENKMFIGDGPFQFNSCAFNHQPQFAWAPHEEINCYIPQ